MRMFKVWVRNKKIRNNVKYLIIGNCMNYIDMKF